MYQDPVALIEQDASYFLNFTIVVATDLPVTPLLKLSKLLYQHNIPLFVIRSYGLIGYLRLSIPLHTIVESKPDFPSYDLRLNEPFETLENYAMSYQFDKLNSTEHSHIPYPVILIQAVNTWKREHNGELPRTTADKDKFKKNILALSIKSGEENFEEAYQNALYAFKPYSIPDSVSEVLNHDSALNINADSSDFWILAAATRQFVENEGQGKLPLMGSIPDLVSETATFIELQSIFTTKAELDRDIVAKHVKDILKDSSRPEDSISLDYITFFCKNVLFIRVLSYRSLELEFNPETSLKENFWQLSDPSFNMHWYFLYRAAENFAEKRGHYPGEELSSDFSKELEEYQIEVEGLLESHEIATDSIEKKYIEEFCRYGNSQLHNIGAIIGGVASQEIIKILTRQWVPLNNTYIFNGLDSNSMVLEM